MLLFILQVNLTWHFLSLKEHVLLQAFAQKKQSIVLNLHMAPKHWYHLSVTHSVGRTLSGGGTLRVYVDGCLASNSKLRSV